MLARHLQQRRCVVATADTGRQTLAELDGASLLEQIDDGVGVAAEGDRRLPASRSARAGPMPSARSRSVVGHRQQYAVALPEQGVVGLAGVGRRARR